VFSETKAERDRNIAVFMRSGRSVEAPVVGIGKYYKGPFTELSEYHRQIVSMLPKLKKMLEDARAYRKRLEDYIRGNE